LRLSWFKVVRVLAFTVVLIASGIYLALTNRKSINLFRLFTLDPEEGRVFFWILVGLLGLTMVPLALGITWKAWVAKQHVGFTDAGVWLPSSFLSSRHVLVPFAEIRAVRVRQMYKERLIEVEMPGRKLRIGQSWLPSPEIFEEILARLQAGVQVLS
jgi:hypothetical protein